MNCWSAWLFITKYTLMVVMVVVVGVFSTCRNRSFNLPGRIVVVSWGSYVEIAFLADETSPAALSGIPERSAS
jgi:hypothetical protein